MIKIVKFVLIWILPIILYLTFKIRLSFSQKYFCLLSEKDFETISCVTRGMVMGYYIVCLSIHISEKLL